MQNKLVRLASKLTTVAMVVSMLGMSMPASAAVSNVKDVMSSLKINATGVTHVVTMTIAPASPTGTLTLNYSSAIVAGTGSAFSATGTGCTGTPTPTEAAGIVSVSDIVGCTDLTVIFTATNAAAAGSQGIVIGGTALQTGNYTIALLTEDTIHVTASVTQTFVYDITTAAACNSAAPVGADYNINLGVLTPDVPANSNGVGTNDHICMKLKTNAVGGALVDMKDAHAGLVSDVNPLYTLTSATENLVSAPGADLIGFGMCNGVGSTVPVTGGTITPLATWTGTCDGLGVNDAVGILTTSFVNIANTNSLPADGGSTAGFYNALVYDVAARATTSSVSGTYHDDITFRAYATF